MSENTKIEWCDHTFNPWWGCEKISPACAHCYAEGFAKRTGNAVWGKLAPRRFFGEKHWEEPLKWNAAAEKAGTRPRVFCASMADVFEEREDLVVPLARLMDLIRRTPNLDWLLLTKRPGNWWARLFGEGEEGEGTVLEFFRRLGRSGMPGTRGWEMLEWLADWAQNRPPHNVWIGTTVEDQTRADERIPELLRIPARVRFLSCEPLLGPVDLSGARLVHLATPFAHPGMHQTPLIDWVIAGGESGPQARPMHPDWARSLRDQCTAAGVPFFFKQWGEWVPAGQLPTVAPADHPLFQGKVEFRDGHYRIGKKHAGRKLDGREHNEFPGHAG